MTKEQKFYQQFRRNLPADADCVRVENALQSGMPDVNVCLNGVEVWVELKCYEHNKVLIRPKQYAWGMRRARAAGQVYIIAFYPLGNIHVWQYPTIDVLPHGDYLQVSMMRGLQDIIEWKVLNKRLFKFLSLLATPLVIYSSIC